MSQSVIPVSSVWVDIANQVTWHANVMVDASNNPIRGLFYNPATHMVMGFFRLTSADNGDAPFTINTSQYYPITAMRYPGECTKDNGQDVYTRFLQMDIAEDGTTRLNFTQAVTHYRILCSFIYPCA